MKLQEILKKQHVVSSLRSRTRDEVIAEMVEVIAGGLPLSPAELTRILIEREDQSPTAMTGGVAVPHGRLAELDRFVLCLGRSRVGVPFGAKEGATTIFFLLLAPRSDTVNHLKVLARIARMVKSEAFCKALMAADTAADMYDRVLQEDDALP